MKLFFICSCLVAPEIDVHYFPESITAEEGTRARLICSVTKGIEQGLQITWLKDGKTLQTRGSPSAQHISIQSSDDSSTIQFRKVFKAHAGVYKCIVSTKLTSVNMSTHLIVNGMYSLGLF